MRIVFMGTPEFAVPTLSALAHSGRHEITLVITQPDRPKGRSGQPAPSPVKQCAQELGIPVYQPERVKSPEAVGRLYAEKPDIIVVAAFGQILSQEILDLPRYGCVNVHGSLLPAYRGAAPVQWAVIDGRKESGITIMQMDAGLDTGDILSQESTPLGPDETAGSLYGRLAQMGGPLLLRTLDQIGAGTAVRISQKNAPSCYAKMLRREMGNLDWSRPAQSLEQLVRGLNPWPGAYTHWNGKLLKIWMAKALPAQASSGETHAANGDGILRGLQEGAAGGRPGSVAVAAKDRLLIRTGEGFLSLTQVQLEGKKKMPVQSFMTGGRIRAGDILE